jgi:glycosyltransferase involved in cell wall biosynthesis
MIGITAAICTRDRPGVVVEALRSVLASDAADFEVLVIDQSAAADTEVALAPWREDARLRYVRTSDRGVSRSRNLALRLARAEVVAYTDDDCVVPPGWLGAMRTVLDDHPSVVLAFCNVAPAPHDARAGFVPAYRRKGTVVVSSFLEKCTARGIGAGMAVRRREILALGGFDEMLGPGGTLRSGEDYDLAVRTLLAGHLVCETDAVEVVHHGFRTWEEGRELTLRDWIGIGAAYSKPLRAGHLSFAVVPLYEFLGNAVWPLLRAALQLRRPSGMKRVTGFLAGFVRGLRTPVDGRSLCFVEPTTRAKRS